VPGAGCHTRELSGLRIEASYPFRPSAPLKLTVPN
jgi:hypothetical protein